MFNMAMTDEWGWGPNAVSAIGAIVVVVGVLAALVIAIATLRDTRKVVKNSERPWIGANKRPRLNIPVDEQDAFHSNTPDHLYITFSNWGKLPGQDVKYTATIGKSERSTGDWILAEIDGVEVIPQPLIGEVLDKTEEIMSTENELRNMILDGMDPQEAYKKYRLF